LCALPKNIQRRVLQQHDGLGIGDAASPIMAIA
jgi:hypothetical protein